MRIGRHWHPSDTKNASMWSRLAFVLYLELRNVFGGQKYRFPAGSANNARPNPSAEFERTL